jgi:hypothetical protein
VPSDGTTNANSTPRPAEITRCTTAPTAALVDPTSIATIGSIPIIAPNTTPPARPASAPFLARASIPALVDTRETIVHSRVLEPARSGRGGTVAEPGEPVSDLRYTTGGRRWVCDPAAILTGTGCDGTQPGAACPEG